MLLNVNECGENKINENFKTIIPFKYYERPNQLENVEYFKYLGSILKMMEVILVKLNVGLLWLKLHQQEDGSFC
jgi:hypothetical protein